MSAVIPYSRSSLQNALRDPHTHQFTIKSSCCVETAIQMAKVSQRMAAENCLQEDQDFRRLSESNIFGISCTAALVSSTPKKGAHRCHVAVVSQSGGMVYSLQLDKELRRSREQEDLVCSTLLLDALAMQCNFLTKKSPHSIPSKSVEASEGEGDSFEAAELASIDVIEATELSPVDIIDAVCSGTVSSAVLVARTDCQDPAAPLTEQFAVFQDLVVPRGTLIYPGSFNPLHEGHVALVEAALSQAGGHQLVLFELAVANVDKPPLPRDEILRRLRQFHAGTNPIFRNRKLANFAVVLTAESLFVGKAALFEGCTFLVGADTFSRLIDRKYYLSQPIQKESDRSAEDSGGGQLQPVVNMIIALSTIKERGCRFLVGGRLATCHQHKIPQDRQVPGGGQPQSNSSSEAVFDTMEDVLARSDVRALLPADIVNIFAGLKESEFRVDISSTAIRQQAM